MTKNPNPNNFYPDKVAAPKSANSVNQTKSPNYSRRRKVAATAMTTLALGLGAGAAKAAPFAAKDATAAVHALKQDVDPSTPSLLDEPHNVVIAKAGDTVWSIDQVAVGGPAVDERSAVDATVAALRAEHQPTDLYAGEGVPVPATPNIGETVFPDKK